MAQLARRDGKAGADDGTAGCTTAAWMMSPVLFLALRQILFSVWVIFREQLSWRNPYFAYKQLNIPDYLRLGQTANGGVSFRRAWAVCALGASYAQPPRPRTQPNPSKPAELR